MKLKLLLGSNKSYAGGTTVRPIWNHFKWFFEEEPMFEKEPVACYLLHKTYFKKSQTDTTLYDRLVLYPLGRIPFSISKSNKTFIDV